MTATPKGRFVWYDLMTSDPDKAVEFYSKLAGWATCPWDGPEPYTLWMNHEQPFGGVMALPDEVRNAGVPPHWIAYVSTPDTDATVAQARQLGAQVYVEPRDIPNVGRFAVLGDPDGGTFAVYTHANPTPLPEGPPRIGDMSWHELAANNLERTQKFYLDLFGWQIIEEHDMGELGPYRLFGLTHPLGGMFRKPEQIPGPGFWLMYIHVPDAAAAARQVEARGGKVLNGPMEVPGGDFITQCLDPQGGAFAVHSAAKK